MQNLNVCYEVPFVSKLCKSEVYNYVHGYLYTMGIFIVYVYVFMYVHGYLWVFILKCMSMGIYIYI